MQKARRFPLAGLSRLAGRPNGADLTSGEYSGESSSSWVIPFLASAVVPFLYQGIGFYAPVPPRLRLPVFPNPLHRVSGRKVLGAPRRPSGGAEDPVQEAYLRAFRKFQSLRGRDGRAWLLTIVRSGCSDRLKQGAVYRHSALEEQAHVCDRLLNQESALLHKERTEQIRRALKNLPGHLREVLVLRAFEKMSYSQIATVAGIPMGTVISRLNRARHQLKQMSFGEAKEIL